MKTTGSRSTSPATTAKDRSAAATTANTEDDDVDVAAKRRSKKSNIFAKWKGRRDFILAQAQVAVVLAVAYAGNHWPVSYHRNENHSTTMFWIMNACLLVAAVCTLHHDKRGSSSRGVQLLSRTQTEEWKGWMQWAFIMYHYYRAYDVYNEIRIFVSAYVWMTGFGNFLYFDKKQDFSLERACSMWIRINYFPCLLSLFLNVPLELYYVVPLHTAGFFITMFTCYLSKVLYDKKIMIASMTTTNTKWNCNVAAIGICFLIHVIFYETPLVNCIKLISKEYHFRFTSDKYSAWAGIFSGLFWGRFRQYMQWCYNSEHVGRAQIRAQWAQRLGGFGLIGFWYVFFGSNKDKFTYNPIHPYVCWIPIAGWLMLRNSSKYLTELHSTILEFMGRITLETYVLQFHVFMCQNVQHIPVVIPGAGPEGPAWRKLCNMLLTGTIFVALAFWTRQITVTTQTTLTDLLTLLRRGNVAKGDDSHRLEDDAVHIIEAAQQQQQKQEGGSNDNIAEDGGAPNGEEVHALMATKGQGKPPPLVDSA